MAKIPNNIKIVIRKFLRELEINQFQIEKAILFGSYANGTYNEWSDIDLMIVSKKFQGDRFKDRNSIRKIKLSVSSNIEPLLYGPEDFNKEDPFISKIIETGINFST